VMFSYKSEGYHCGDATYMLCLNSEMIILAENSMVFVTGERGLIRLLESDQTNVLSRFRSKN